MQSQSLQKEASIALKKWPLFGLLVTQFIAAFSDNGWKLVVFTLATRSLMGHIDVTSAEFASTSQLQATLALLVFLIPSLFFSLPGGAFADRFSKRNIIIGTRVGEGVLMAAATLTLFVSPTDLFIPYLLLALTGAQSAILSPSKYGILPELVPNEQLSRGNGFLEMWTMLAIIAGTGLGSVLLFADSGGTRPQLTWTAPLWLALLALVGLVFAFKIPKVSPASLSKNGVIDSLRQASQYIRSDRVLRLAISGCMCYWLIISLLGQNVLVYAKALVHDLSRGELLQGIPPASFGVGIAVGAILGGRLSGDHIETGLIPLGASIFAITALLLGVVQPAMGGTVVILLLMGIGSGLLIVPLNALIQWRAPADKRGAIIALGNILNTTAMITGSLIATGMALFGFNLHIMLVTSSFLVIAATLWAIWLLPEALVRLIFIVLFKRKM